MAFILGLNSSKKLSMLIPAYLIVGLIYCSSRVEAIDANTRTAGICESDPTCVCISNNDEFVLHCEGDLHAKLVHEYAKATFTCNDTIPSTSLNRNYYSLLRLNSYKLTKFEFLECPEPTGSYAALFLPYSANSSLQWDTPHKPDVFVRNLEIMCGGRNEFSIERKHLEGLSKLNLLRINCRALSELPNDLFYDTVPNLHVIGIIGTKIEYIPEMLFAQLSSLIHLEFIGSRLKKIEKKSIIGLKSLQTLNFAENNVSVIEDDVFDLLTKIKRVNLTKNYITTFPKSLRNLFYLTMLDLSYNSLKNVTFDDCLKFPDLQSLYLMDNMITDIDIQCFSLLQQLKNIDISGNALLKLPDHPITIDSLDNFIFNYNSVNSIHIEREFLFSTGLYNLEMRNSSIASLHPKALHGLPRMRQLDLSWNNIQVISENFFVHNSDLRVLRLQGNKISTLLPKVFQNNLQLFFIDISSNNISFVDGTLLAKNTALSSLDISHNHLKQIPENFLSHVSNLREINISYNKIVSLNKDFFRNVPNMRILDLSHNMFNSLPKNIFLPYKNSNNFLVLNLEGNQLSSLPLLEFPKLKTLNLSGNKLEGIPDRTFLNMPLLETLDLSNNLIKTLANSEFVASKQKLVSLDLSSNDIREIPDNMFTQAFNLRVLDLSVNKIESFYLEWIVGALTLREINLSSNNMSFIGVFNRTNYRRMVRRSCYGYSEGIICEELLRSCPVKVFKLSKNNLSFNYTQTKYDDATRAWGRVSPLVYCKSAEEIYLDNNLIDEIFLDWRVQFPHLRIIDLRNNRFKYLPYQDQLFSTSQFHDNGTVVPYACTHSLTVDLRENQIRGVELHTSMLTDPFQGNQSEERYGHATILLEDNPFTCGCGLLNFLRVLSNDVALTSEMQRREGKNWIMPAKLDVGNLSCW